MKVEEGQKNSWKKSAGEFYGVNFSYMYNESFTEDFVPVPEQGEEINSRRQSISHLLEMVRYFLKKKSPLYHQPENILIDNTYIWKRLVFIIGCVLVFSLLFIRNSLRD